MSKGALIYAYNTRFDYVSLAEINLHLIRQHLGLPVAVITDSASYDQAQSAGFDHVIVDDTPDRNQRRFDLGDQILATPWRNGSRSLAWDLTPWDQTLLIDADYLIFSDRLNLLFDSGRPFAAFGEAYDITGKNVFGPDRRIAAYSLLMMWATAVYFDRSLFSESVFSMMRQVRENYRYYSQLYRFGANPYRNDFALTIALNALSGYGDTGSYTIPWSCHTLTTRARIIDYDPARGVKYLYTYRRGDAEISAVGRSHGVDLHVMDKMSVLDFKDAITSKT